MICLLYTNANVPTSISTIREDLYFLSLMRLYCIILLFYLQLGIITLCNSYIDPVTYSRCVRSQEVNYSETSQNRSLKKLIILEYRPIFLSLCRAFLCKRSLTKPATSLNRPFILVLMLASLEKFHCLCKMSQTNI
jgi:hypothetical protein